MESLAERCPITRALLHSSIKVPGIRPPPHTRFPSGGKGPPWREMPVSGVFFSIYSRAPSEGTPPEAPCTDSLQREMFHPQRPLHPAVKVPGRRSLLQFPEMGALCKEMSVSSAFSTYPSGSPAREPSLQVPFTELPQRGTLHIQSPFQPYLNVPGR